MFNQLRERFTPEPPAKAEPAARVDPDLTDDAPAPYQYPRPVLQEPRVVTVTAGATSTQQFSFVPDVWHIATPNGEYVLVAPGGSVNAAVAWVLGRGGFVAFPGMGSTLTLQNTGAASATVIITPLNTGVRFAYDPGWGV